jgi:hypothetical protein
MAHDLRVPAPEGSRRAELRPSSRQLDHAAYARRGRSVDESTLVCDLVGEVNDFLARRALASGEGAAAVRIRVGSHLQPEIASQGAHLTLTAFS